MHRFTLLWAFAALVVAATTARALPVTERALPLGRNHAGVDMRALTLTAPIDNSPQPVVTLATTTLRLGVLSNADLMVSAPDFNANGTTTGDWMSGPAVARLKVGLFASDDRTVAVAIMPWAAVPFAAGMGVPSAGIAVPIALPLPIGLRLGLQPALSVDAYGAPQLPLSAALSRDLDGGDDEDGLFAYGEGGAVVVPMAPHDSHEFVGAAVGFRFQKTFTIDLGVNARTARLEPSRGAVASGFVGFQLRL